MYHQNTSEKQLIITYLYYYRELNTTLSGQLIYNSYTYTRMVNEKLTSPNLSMQWQLQLPTSFSTWKFVTTCRWHMLFTLLTMVHHILQLGVPLTVREITAGHRTISCQLQQVSGHNWICPEIVSFQSVAKCKVGGQTGFYWHVIKLCVFGL